MATAWKPTPDPLSCSAIEALGKTLVFYINGKGEIWYLTAPTGQVGPKSHSAYESKPILIASQDPDSGVIKDMPVPSSGPQVSAVTWINADGKTEIRVYYVGKDSTADHFKLRELVNTSPDNKNFGPWTPGDLTTRNESCLETSIVAANVNYWGATTAGDVKVYYQRLTTKPSVAYASVTTKDWSQTDISLTWT